MLRDFAGDILSVDQVGWSLILVIVVMAAYLGFCFRRKIWPDLTQGVTIVIGCFGVVAAIALMWLTYKSAAVDLGVLHDQKYPILIGGFAMLWVSISSTYKSLLKSLTT